MNASHDARSVHNDGALARIAALGVLPVATFASAESAVRATDALHAGGLGCVEITLRSPAAHAAIEAVRAAHPTALIGAGTVLDTGSARTAVDAGADFIVSPGWDPDVVTWCTDHDVPVLPGVTTPSEMQTARRANLSTVKFFPAALAGGVALLRTVETVFADLRFVPTGGIGVEELPEYLALAHVIAVGGTWIVAPELVAARDWGTITQRAATAVAIARQRDAST